MCFYCILGLLFIFTCIICRILPIQLLGCHTEINARLIYVIHDNSVELLNADHTSAGHINTTQVTGHHAQWNKTLPFTPESNNKLVSFHSKKYTCVYFVSEDEQRIAVAHWPPSSWIHSCTMYGLINHCWVKIDDYCHLDKCSTSELTPT